MERSHGKAPSGEDARPRKFKTEGKEWQAHTAQQRQIEKHMNFIYKEIRICETNLQTNEICERKRSIYGAGQAGQEVYIDPSAPS